MYENVKISLFYFYTHLFIFPIFFQINCHRQLRRGIWETNPLWPIWLLCINAWRFFKMLESGVNLPHELCILSGKGSDDKLKVTRNALNYLKNGFQFFLDIIRKLHHAFQIAICTLQTFTVPNMQEEYCI